MDRGWVDGCGDGGQRSVGALGSAGWVPPPCCEGPTGGDGTSWAGEVGTALGSPPWGVPAVGPRRQRCGTAVPAVSRSSSAGLGAAFQGFPSAPLFPGSESFSRGSGASTGWEHPALGHPLPRAPDGARPVPRRAVISNATPQSSTSAGTESIPAGSGTPRPRAPPALHPQPGTGLRAGFMAPRDQAGDVTVRGGRGQAAAPGQLGMDRGVAEAGAAWRVQPCRGPCPGCPGVSSAPGVMWSGTSRVPRHDPGVTPSPSSQTGRQQETGL